MQNTKDKDSRLILINVKTVLFYPKNTVP